MELITWFMFSGLGFLFLIWKGYIKLNNLSLQGSGDREITVDKQFGMNLVKNQLIQCPDGYVRFDGANSNISGTYDIHTTDGRIIRGIDSRINMRWGCDPLTAMTGRGTMLCNVRICDGVIVSWSDFLGREFEDKTRYVFDLLDLEKRRNTNILGYGFSRVDALNYDKLIDEWGKGVGKTVKDIGLIKKGGWDDREIQYQQPIMRDELEGGAVER